jgi:hypothetical protein
MQRDESVTRVMMKRDESQKKKFSAIAIASSQCAKLLALIGVEH